MTVWHPAREDVPALLALMLLPLLLAAPQILGWLDANPLLYLGQVDSELRAGLLPGLPHNDVNVAFHTQALGYRVALDWLHGHVPWWNPYSGVGMPLAAEYQPAAFFPLTLLFLLPRGLTWIHVSLQAIAGLGAYGLLRQLGLGRLAATTGALLWAFNGTLAWAGNSQAWPAPFLPWMLWGIERARAKAVLRFRDGWRLFAFGMALNLLAGFPETAFFGGLLALAWSALRFAQLQERRIAYAWRVALGGAVGVALAAPQLLAFLTFAPDAWVGAHHDGLSAHGALPARTVISSLIAPYLYGPIHAYSDESNPLTSIWDWFGGYVDIVILIVAAYGLAARRNALTWFLAAWILFALGKTYDLEPFTVLWNLVPGITNSWFFRYGQPIWELPLIVLAAHGLDDLAAARRARPLAAGAAAVMLVVALGGALLFGPGLLKYVRGEFAVHWLYGSLAWAAVTGIACFGLLLRPHILWTAPALAGLLAVDAMLMFAVPTLSNPRGGTVDWPAIAFLRQNLGLQRFFTLGPIQPNYGAYLGIASINYNYIPVPSRWVAWVQAHLDSETYPGLLAGTRAGEPTPAQELRRNLAAYEWAGVKYVVARAGTANVIGREVYSDAVVSIDELPDPRPYFEVVAGNCAIGAERRERVAIDCATPATLVRRELFFPGWRARVNGTDAAITEYGELFQAIDLPAGASEVRYRYAPPGIPWAWLAMLLAGAICAGSAFVSLLGKARLRRRRLVS